MGALSVEEKKTRGAAINQAKAQVEALLQTPDFLAWERDATAA